MNLSNGFHRITDEDVYAKTIARLDESQREAAESEAKNVVIRASAGSGKTHTLIAAIAAYRYENVNDRICAITYTRAARAEMESRLQEMGVYDVDVTTIHVWARKRLEDLAIKYDFKIRILEESQIKSVLNDLIQEYLKTSRIKFINLNILYSYITGSKKMDITDNYRRTLNALESRYIAYKRNNVLYDFTDYPLYLYDILKTYNETIKDIDALFVDEFQDVDENQLETFKLVEAKKKFFIGDGWQSIYQFRGADGKVFEKLNDFEMHKLTYNYRSYQEIIDYATTVRSELFNRVDFGEDCYIGEIDHAYPSVIKCDRGPGAQIYTINPFGRIVYKSAKATPNIAAAEVVTQFLDLQPMILCRFNKQVKAIKDLGYFNVDTVHQAKGLEYPNVIVIDSTMSSVEDLNIAYVALTRAQNNLLVINWQQFEFLFKIYMLNHKTGFGGF